MITVIGTITVIVLCLTTLCLSVTFIVLIVSGVRDYVRRRNPGSELNQRILKDAMMREARAKELTRRVMMQHNYGEPEIQRVLNWVDTGDEED